MNWRKAARCIARSGAVLLATACGTGAPPGVAPAPPEEGERGLAAVHDVLTRAQIQRINANSMEQLLDGRFTGVQVLRHGGEPVLRIRGAGEPLLVVDGVPTGTFRFLWGMNPLDIERIEILKDASTSLYGVQGANGVVLIETRRQ
jgi:TonB-dependent SusC/RagA subfamily outer membrane receptor